MPTKQDYEIALGQLDKPTRVCVLYLKKLIIDKIKAALGAQQPPAPKVNLSKLETEIDSLRKQIDGFRPKIEAGYKISQEHDDQEKYIQKLTKTAEIALDDMKKYFEEQYKSGQYSEGTRRKMREEGLLE